MSVALQVVHGSDKSIPHVPAEQFVHSVRAVFETSDLFLAAQKIFEQLLDPEVKLTSFSGTLRKDGVGELLFVLELTDGGAQLLSAVRTIFKRSRADGGLELVLRDRIECVSPAHELPSFLK